jgi:hypothetical protein
LNANPLDDISATENRTGVMLKGKWHQQQELNAWLDESAQAISTSLRNTKAALHKSRNRTMFLSLR